MSFNQLLLILKARFKIIATVFLLIFGLTIAFNMLAQKKYVASASLLLNYKGKDPITGVVLPAQLMPGYMATQVDIIYSKKVALRVVRALNLSKSATSQEAFNTADNIKTDIDTWLASKILENVTVNPSKESSVIEIIFEGNDPEFSSLMANTFAKAYKDTVVELKVEPAKVAATFLKDQVTKLRVNLEQAQSKLSNYQQANGLTSLNGSLDVETARLGQLSSELVMAQSQLFDARSRNKSTRQNASPDVAANPLVLNLKSAISAAETRLSQLSERYGANHPQYISAVAELNKQKRLLNKAVSTAKNNVGATNKIYQQRVSELQSALARQKKKLLNLNLSRNELSVIQTEVMNAQNALTTASKRLTQTVQESSSNQTDVSILNVATPPDAPSSPNVLLNIIIGFVLGLIAATLIGLMFELFDRRLRSKDDLSELLEIPVFGLINNKQESKQTLFPALTKRIGKVA